MIEFNATRNNGFFSNLFEYIDFLHIYDDLIFDKVKINNFSLRYSNENKSSFNDFFKDEINFLILINPIIF